LESDLTDFLAHVEHKPIGLAQKIYVLADNVCIAMAGFVMEMKHFLEDFSRFCKTAPKLDFDSIKEYLHEYDFTEYRGCMFFIMIVDRSTEGIIDVKEISMADVTEVDSQTFDQSLAFGSGAEEYLKIINQKMLFRSSFKDGDIRQSVVKQGALIAHLLTLERATKKNLLSAWGGAYEFAIYDGKRFIKPDNVAYIVNFGVIDANGSFEMPMPVFVLHHRYEGEILVITKVLWKNHIIRDDGTDFYILTSDDIITETYLVPPIKSGIGLSQDLDKLRSFETAWIGMGYLVNTHDQLSILPHFFTASVDMKVVFTAEAERVEIYIRDTMLPFLKEMMTLGVTSVRHFE
jgi:hypothetical protein